MNFIETRRGVLKRSEFRILRNARKYAKFISRTGMLRIRPDVLPEISAGSPNVWTFAENIQNRFHGRSVCFRTEQFFREKG